jgi:3-oxoacyl-[acyl-carrier-protein] synthase-3
MDGMEVFNFGIRDVPIDIKYTLESAGKSIGDIDLVIFHQANKMMTDFLAKRLKFDLKNVPYSLKGFGNTGPASIPLTIVTEMSAPEKFPKRENVIMSGFGAGLSWGTVMTTLEDCSISSLIEY